ncbi:MAG: hypothetical protein AB8U25_05040 [Rickettsiales endosymbiont of Dermacentor nuttalli]
MTTINIVAGCLNNKPIVPFIFNCSRNRELFERWKEHFLLKELKLG